MADDEFKRGLLKTLLVLREYLPNIVIGGGWVPLIYYHYVLGKTVEPLMTRDIDLIVPRQVPIVGSKSIDQLLTGAGLKVELMGSGTPPVTCYEGTMDGTDVEVEFLTHWAGGRDQVATRVQQGLTAQALRYMAALLENTLDVRIPDLTLPGASGVTVRVPSPGAYIFNKGLVFPRRKQEAKKAKDLYYIFDILANCPELRAEVVDGLTEMRTEYPSAWFRDFRQNLEVGFADITSEGVRLVTSQRPGNALPGLNEAQFRQYVVGVFQALLADIAGS